MSGSPATSERMPLIRAASLLIALSNASGPSSSAACDLPAVGHLAQRGRVDRRRHLRVDGFDGGENRDLRRGDAEGDREIDRVLADIDLVLERRGNVDGRIGDDQDLVVGRHVHDEDVADAAAGPKPGLPRHHGAQQLVGVQAALHQQLGLTLAHQLHGLGRRCVAVRRIDDPDLAEVDPVLLSRPRGSSPPDRRGSA